ASTTYPRPWRRWRTARPWVASSRCSRGSARREVEQLRHGVPVARGGGDAQLLLDEHAAELAVAVALRRVEVGLAPSHLDPVAARVERLERAHGGGGRLRVEERDVQAVRLGLPERIAGDDLLELALGAHDHRD